jgi:hypothetical protein
MTREQFAQIEMRGKVAGFASTYNGRIPQDSLARARIASLGALPGRTGSRPGTNVRETARSILWADLGTVHQTMLAVAIDHRELRPISDYPTNAARINE